MSLLTPPEQTFCAQAHGVDAVSGLLALVEGVIGGHADSPSDPGRDQAFGETTALPNA